MPKQLQEFKKYALENPEILWVQKSNEHRGIEIKNLKNLNLNINGTFVQKFVENPLLIDQRYTFNSKTFLNYFTSYKPAQFALVFS